MSYLANERGFGVILGILAIAVIILMGFVAMRTYKIRTGQQAGALPAITLEYYGNAR